MSESSERKGSMDDLMAAFDRSAEESKTRTAAKKARNRARSKPTAVNYDKPSVAELEKMTTQGWARVSARLLQQYGGSVDSWPFLTKTVRTLREHMLLWCPNATPVAQYTSLVALVKHLQENGRVSVRALNAAIGSCKSVVMPTLEHFEKED